MIAQCLTILRQDTPPTRTGRNALATYEIDELLISVRDVTKYEHRMRVLGGTATKLQPRPSRAHVIATPAGLRIETPSENKLLSLGKPVGRAGHRLHLSERAPRQRKPGRSRQGDNFCRHPSSTRASTVFFNSVLRPNETLRARATRRLPCLCLTEKKRRCMFPASAREERVF